MAPPPPPPPGDEAAPAPLGVSLGLVFQSIIDWFGHTVVGFEALIRPFNGAEPLPPAAWLEAATRAGTGVEADVACLTRITAELSRWGRWPGPGLLFVNVRWGTLASPAAFTAAWEALTRWVHPNQVICEVAEHGSIAPDWSALRRLYPAVTWALDDVGVGKADLWKWLALAPAWVKLDRTVVAAVPHDPRAQTLVGALTAAAHATGSRVIAEGVETQAQIIALQRLGIDAGQGFILDPPSWPTAHGSRVPTIQR
jgi:EAL domain-containing protein (putative c-di-GMP-specific phosphodiesterase class I)